MHRITAFFRDLILKMVRAFFIWGIIAGLASVGFVFITSRHAPILAEWVLISLVTVITALLGLVSALAWELTHIPHIIRLARGQHGKREEPMRIAAHVQKSDTEDR